MTQSFAIITPARNEEANIEKTLISMVAQTIKPVKWVIVSDGSTDSTDEIVKRYASEHDFIELLRRDTSGSGNFGSKVYAFQAGYEKLEGIEYDFVGNLDGDVSFAPDYFEKLLTNFENEKMGLAGGIILEQFDEKFLPQTMSDNSVAGAVQLFRRECYESFGGYIPMKLGGIDSCAEILSRFKGWEVKTIRELEVKHHGRVVTGGKNILQTRFKKGKVNYLLGYHPLFQFFVSLGRMKNSPYIIGGILMFFGYLAAGISGLERQVPEDMVKFLRQEQMDRLLTMFKLKAKKA